MGQDCSACCTAEFEKKQELDDDENEGYGFARPGQ